MTVHFAPPPPAAVSRLLSRFDRTQLAAFITVAIDLLDLADGDADAEDDERDGVMMIGLAIDYDPGVEIMPPDGLPGTPEDAEVDEPDGCAAGDDNLGFIHSDHLPGDPDDAELDDDDVGADDLGEDQQLFDDVPTVPVVSLDVDLVTGLRRDLGRVNLSTSFQSCELMLSADSGRTFQARGSNDQLGVPV